MHKLRNIPPQARAIILDVAARRGIDPLLIVNPCRRPRVFHARAEVAKALDSRGYSSPRIGSILNHDHSTILFYLGRGKKSPSAEPPPKPPKKRRWKSPRVRHLRWLPRICLKPYAGADMTEYVWKRRTNLTEATNA